MEKLNQRTDKFTIVLNDSGADLLKSTNYIYNKIMCDEMDIVYLAIIKHDKDINEEDGHVKTPHYHVVLITGGVYRLSSIINWLVKLFHINENQITIDKCNSIAMQSRYLTHMDDFDKTPYLMTEVKTNDEDAYKRYCNLQRVKDLNDLLSVVKYYNYDLERIMVNVMNYDKYRKYVLDLISNNYKKGRY